MKTVKNIIAWIVCIVLFAFASVIFFKMMFGVMAMPAEDIVEKVFFYFFGIFGIAMYIGAFAKTVIEAINRYRNKA